MRIRCVKSWENHGPHIYSVVSISSVRMAGLWYSRGQKITDWVVGVLCAPEAKRVNAGQVPGKGFLSMLLLLHESLRTRSCLLFTGLRVLQESNLRLHGKIKTRCPEARKMVSQIKPNAHPVI